MGVVPDWNDAPRRRKWRFLAAAQGVSRSRPRTGGKPPFVASLSRAKRASLAKSAKKRCADNNLQYREILFLSCSRNWATIQDAHHVSISFSTGGSWPEAAAPGRKIGAAFEVWCAVHSSAFSEGINGRMAAARSPTRCMSTSEHRGNITGIPACSGKAGHRQDIVLPDRLICTIPHPLTRISLAFGTPMKGVADRHTAAVSVSGS